MRRTTTQDNLKLITNRNDGRRLSLVMDDDYDNTDESTQSSKEQEDEATFTKLKTQADSKSRRASLVPNSIEIETIGVVTGSDSGSSGYSGFEQLSHGEISQNLVDINKKFDSQYRLRNDKKKKKGKKEENERLELELEKDISDRFRSKFADIEYYSKSTTIFDAEYFKKSEFFGIYILFWLGTGFLMLQNGVHAYLNSYIPFRQLPVVLLLRKDLIKVALTDGAMYLTSYGPFFIQYACLQNWIQWKTSGWLIHCIYEFIHVFFWIKFASYKEFPWIAKVFLCLHGFVFLMKMHSYGYYNGYLWNIVNELKFSELYLKRLNLGKAKLPAGYEESTITTTLKDSITFCKFELEFQSRSTILLDSADTVVSEKVFHNLDADALQQRVEFPQNINLHNYLEFSMYPTVVYTLNFTRTKRIRWKYVLEKCIAIFGIIFLMILVAQNMMYPTVIRALKLRDLPVNERFIQYWFVLLDMIPPFLMEYLFTFFLIWDFILNAIAELSRFADRDFYGPWWSCTDWSEYARIWNRPVHKFLLRHVYHSSLSTLQLNKAQSGLVTFVISSIVHEIVMYVIFDRLRGYLLLLQMSQLPLIMLSNTKYMKNKKVLGNVICWFGFISGPAMICTAYLMF